jgi:hypothetical protein
MSTLSTVITDLAPVVLPLVQVVVGCLVAWAVALIKKHTGVTVSAANEARLNTMADNAIGKAEQWAVNKTTGSAPPPQGSDKLNTALMTLQTAMIGSGLEGQTEAELKDLLESRLGLKNLSAGS